jgi:hypothetical protein
MRTLFVRWSASPDVAFLAIRRRDLTTQHPLHLEIREETDARHVVRVRYALRVLLPVEIFPKNAPRKVPTRIVAINHTDLRVGVSNAPVPEGGVMGSLEASP